MTEERRDEVEVIEPAPAAVAAAWVWDDARNVYRNTLTRRTVTARQLVTLRNYYIEAATSEMDRLTRRLLNYDIDLQQWVLEMRRQTKTNYINQYMLARGGRQNMVQSDWGRLGGLLKRQYEYIQNFARDIDTGRASGGQIRTRARMYVSGSTQAFERAKAESNGLPRLPQYPGDGQTQCRSNCQCGLHYQDEGDHWNVYWRLGVAEHCPDCVRLAEEWKPLTVP
ncbi:MAG: hypothetical protein GWN58_64570, partial [Anaerolineae bacterium]|nr:hypothetical protein [Anaerolineae bacterium]